MVCGSLEIEILNTFWNLNSVNEDKDISIQDVVDELSANGTQRAYTTIKTVMDRLVTKSILVRYKVGKICGTINEIWVFRSSCAVIKFHGSGLRLCIVAVSGHGCYSSR